MGERLFTYPSGQFVSFWDILEAAMFWIGCVYHFCRVHDTLMGTPAMAAGLTISVWSVHDLLFCLRVKRESRHAILKVLKKLMPKHKQGHVVTLAMMISGIVLSGKAHLSAMSLEAPHPAKPKSLEKRMRRWVKNNNVDKEVYYLPDAQMLLEHLSNYLLTWSWMAVP